MAVSSGQLGLQNVILSVGERDPGPIWIWMIFSAYFNFGKILKILKVKREFAQSGCEQANGWYLILPTEIFIFMNIMEYCSPENYFVCEVVHYQKLFGQLSNLLRQCWWGGLRWRSSTRSSEKRLYWEWNAPSSILQSVFYVILFNQGSHVWQLL